MKQITLILVVLFSLSNVNAQKVLTLEQALEMALDNNSTVKNARLDETIAQKKIWETTAIGLPQINAEGSFQNFIDIPTSVLPANAFNPAAPEGELVGIQFGTDYNMSGSITVSQLIFDGRYIVGLQATRAVKDLYELSSKKTEQDVTKSVSMAYYTVVVTQSTILTLEESLIELNTIYGASQLIADAGMIEQTDVDQLSINVRTLENNLESVKAQLNIAKNFLKLEIGMGLDEPIEVSKSLDDYVAKVRTDNFSEFNSSSNINYLLLENQLKLNQLSMKNEKAFALPTLGAFFTHQQQALRNDFDFFESGKPWYPSTIWGVKLSIPIFSSGSRLSKISQAKLEMEKTQNNLDNLDAGIKVQFLKAKMDFDNALRTLETEEKNLEVTQKIMKNVEIKFKESIASSIQLSQSQTQYLAAKANYISAAYKLINTKLELENLQSK